MTGRALKSRLILDLPKAPFPAIFAYGFRPFFLSAGCYAVIAMGCWLAVYAAGASPPTGLPPQLWHAHEMVFGFVAAAIAGFLLTAVPSWTGRQGYSGRPLALLVSLWLAGRIAVGAWGLLAEAAAAIDLAFFPGLALTLAPALIRARSFRNLPFLVILTILFAANALFHAEMLGWTKDTAGPGLLLAINTMLVLVVIVGGRIIPSFTLNWLRRRGKSVTIGPTPGLDAAAIGATILVLAVDLISPDTPAAGVVALAGALLHAARLARWRGMETASEPILWILHLGYGWVVVGLTLKAAWLLTGASFAANWLHALTVGVFATMILAVMTRVALGHTGRALVASRPIVAVYASITLAGAVRVFGPGLGPWAYLPSIAAAGLLWIAAFLLFLAVYTPILVRPRLDGRPG